MDKFVYSFGGGKAEGHGAMKDVLGGKGAGLAEMTNAGLPVPPGFIKSRTCRAASRFRWPNCWSNLAFVGTCPMKTAR